MQFKGTVVFIEGGAVNSIFMINIGGGNQASSTISIRAVDELMLEVGQSAYAIIKKASVMVGTDD